MNYQITSTKIQTDKDKTFIGLYKYNLLDSWLLYYSESNNTKGYLDVSEDYTLTLIK